jgi:hypothetical protein
MQLHQVLPQVELNTPKSRYTCIVCKKGTMIPAVQEGEPEYTDNFMCTNCHHHDTIPSRGILTIQYLTSLLGMLMCFSLLVAQGSGALDSFRQSEHSASIQGIGLSLLAVAFICGFSYLLSKAVAGQKQRAAYLRVKTDKKPTTI